MDNREPIRTHGRYDRRFLHYVKEHGTDQFWVALATLSCDADRQLAKPFASPAPARYDLRMRRRFDHYYPSPSSVDRHTGFRAVRWWRAGVVCSYSGIGQ